MTLANARPLRFSPQGLSDAIAEEDAFPGACSTLTNLIPDPSTKNVWTCRPASIEKTSAFTGFTTPTGVPVFKVVGNYVFGLVSTAATPGFDQPFCFNLLTNAFVSVTGVTSSNVPATQATTGDWTPPTMDVMGNFVIVTHPGFTGYNNYIGWFDISTLTAPVWHAGNLALHNGIGNLTITIVSAGSGYTTGTYNNVLLSSEGSGSGALATVVTSGGQVMLVSIVFPGSGWTVGENFYVHNKYIGGTGSGFQGSVTNLAGSGIGSLTITNAGTFSTNGIYPDVPLAGGAGSGGTATIGVAGGVITSAFVEMSGTGYNVGDVLTNSGFSGMQLTVATIIPIGGTIGFTTAPSWVAQFNGRAWFGINPSTGIPSVIFSDVYALQCTNANQVLTFGDNTPLTCAAPLGLANLLGGVIQSLIVFKSLNGIIQITGDAATSNLSVNQVPGGSGTLSPRSLCEHPQGLLYLDHDGYRMVTLDGNCTDPIGVAGQGVIVPLIDALTPTRINAACNGSILRVSLLNAASVWVEYWYDTVRKVWSGPHSFPSTMINNYDSEFVLASQSAPVGLWLGQVIPSASSTFTENSVALTWAFQTAVLNDNQQMAQSEIAEMQVKTSSNASGTPTLTVNAQDENANVIQTFTYTYGSNSALKAVRCDFPNPVVYNRLAINMTGASSAGFQVGDLYVRARVLGYIQAVAGP